MLVVLLLHNYYPMKFLLVSYNFISSYHFSYLLFNLKNNFLEQFLENFNENNNTIKTIKYILWN